MSEPRKPAIGFVRLKFPDVLALAGLDEDLRISIRDRSGQVINSAFVHPSHIYGNFLKVNIVENKNGIVRVSAFESNDENKYGFITGREANFPEDIVLFPDKAYGGKTNCCGKDSWVTTKIDDIRLVYCPDCGKIWSMFAFVDW